MRLLNTRTLQFEEYIRDDVPKYAILSHRWQEEEVSHQHMITNCFTTRKGFEKIRSFCHQAESRGLQYGWVDTCCIDKSSSAELSEAINSMYRWYQHAVECYVYLFDVEDDIIIDGSDVNSLDTSFAKSQWFTRGWTLQELIAPATVFFFNRYWKKIGDKSTCSELLSTITNIPNDVLTADQKPSSYAVVQRMSWAASRRTTRAEDRAYSLLGIFGVNIPLLYGEGENAFLRLQQEICRTVDDMSFLLFREDEDDSMNGAVDVFAKSPSSFVPQDDFVTKNRLVSRHEEVYGFSCERDHMNDQPFINIEPLTLTNSGIILNLTLVPWSVNTFLVPVCKITSDPTGLRGSRYICIFLVRSHSGAKWFRRVKRSGLHYQEACMAWSRVSRGQVMIPDTANWNLAFRERASIISPHKHATDIQDGATVLDSLEFTGIKLKLYDKRSKTYWTPSSDNIITRTPFGSETLVPFDRPRYELCAIFRVKRWGSWWYICLGLDEQALPFFAVTSKLPNQNTLCTTEPSLMDDTDVDYVLSTEDCLAMTKSEDFSGTVRHADFAWVGLRAGVGGWKFPPVNINDLHVENYEEYLGFRDLEAELHWKIDDEPRIEQINTYHLEFYISLKEGQESRPKQSLSARVSGYLRKATSIAQELRKQSVKTIR